LIVDVIVYLTVQVPSTVEL